MTTVDARCEGTLDLADQLVAEGRHDEAIARLTDANRRDAHVSLAREILRLRHELFFDVVRGASRSAWPPSYPDRFSDVRGIPEVDGSDLDAEAVGAGLLHHGSLLVRNLVESDVAATLVADVDAALDAADVWLEGGDPAPEWFEPFIPSPPFSVGMSRRFVVEGGGVLGPDSPLAMCAVIDVLADAGLGPVLREYLGERPALSAKKTTLRRVPPDSGSDWHQDGSFLGPDVRTVNVWLALSDCGVDAPGLDVVGRRIDLVETGTEGAIFDWSVGRPVVERVAGASGIVRPVFRPGDALLFDERNLHATATSAAMTRSRHAVEAWFFAPSRYPDDQVPLVF